MLILFGILAFPISGFSITYNFNFYNDGQVVQPVAPVAPVAPVVVPVVAPAPVQSQEKHADPEKLKRSGVALVGGYFSKSYLGSKKSFEEGPYWSNGEYHYTSSGSAKLDYYRGVSVGLSFISSYDFSIEPKLLIGKMSAESMNRLGQKYQGNVPGFRIDFKNKYWISDHFGIFLGIGGYGYTGKLKDTTTYNRFSRDNENSINTRGFGADVNIGPVIQIGSVYLDGGVGYGLESSSLSGADNDEKLGNWNLQTNLTVRI